MLTFLKRIFLFAVVNMLILVTLSFAFQVVIGLLGIRMGFEPTIWIFYGVIGMGGAFINLALSRIMAKWAMGVRVIDPQSQNPGERRLLEIVRNLAQRARLPKTPEVGVYQGAEVNAFATGPTKARALVAVSTGLLENMDEASIEGVLGHEITHIANGDMVTMTLVQGVINTMVLIMARILANLIASQLEERSRPVVQMVIFYALQMLLSLLGSVVVCYFSRAREFRADLGGARLAGREHMLSGLKSLRHVYGQVDDAHPSLATLKISGHSASLFATLFATHPPLEERIQRLETVAL